MKIVSRIRNQSSKKATFPLSTLTRRVDSDFFETNKLQGYRSVGLTECSPNFQFYFVVIILLMIYIILNTSKTKLSLTDNKLLFSLFLCRWSRLMLYLPSLVRLHKTKKYQKKYKPKTYLPTDLHTSTIHIFILTNISI